MKRIIGVLVLLAVFVVGTAFAQEMPPKELLQPDQLKKIEKIRTDFQKQQIELKAKLKVATLELRELLRSARVPNVAKLQKKQAEISKLRAQLAALRLNQQIAVRKILTDDQWKQLQARRMTMWKKRAKRGMHMRMHERREHMRRPGMRRPGPGPMERPLPPGPPRDNNDN